MKNLTPEGKDILADELWADLGHSNHKDPDIKPLLESLLEQREAGSTVPWDDLKKQIGLTK